MRFHWLRLRATAHATEDPVRVRQAMQFLSALDEEGFDAATEASPIESHHGGDVIFFETQVKRAREIRACLAHLRLDHNALLREVERRTDDDGVFYLRFDKQASYLGSVKAVQGDDAVQIRLKPEVHPANRDNAISALTAWLETD